jgi:hypothetical protein
MSRRLTFFAGLIGSILTLAAGTAPAGASVTIGQTGTPGLGCGNAFDFLQPTVTSGNTYVVPAAGGVTSWTVTSWSTQAGSSAGMLAMKVYRPLGGVTYMVVGHDGPHALTPSAPNTFTASVAAKAGDVLGGSSPPSPGGPLCWFTASGDSSLVRNGNLPDGGSANDFSPLGNLRANISAVVNPSNTFTLGGITRNKKKGTATLTMDVPNPGELIASGNGVKAASSSGRAVTSKSVPAGLAQLVVKATGKKKKRLNETGKVKLNVAVTYTPTGGDPSTQSLKVKLKKSL